ncbi:hypothetical protein CRG98_000124 [Punica granatum]|uniref:Uncharacterized protein n=1 Tax=Punica granatum TaxID=22663 RepID=A0A2I0LFQ6_PUNGR|nr:hypothetical protein CRG98_000124 [Punica granatum]
MNGGGTLGMRSGSYGSLQQQQNGLLPIQTTPSPPLPPRKPSKILKDKEKLAHWIFKSAGKKKVGMLLLCLISAAVFLWVLYVDTGDGAQEVAQMIKMNNDTSDVNTSLYSADGLGLKRPLLLPPPPPPSVFLGYTLPSGHPCNNFTLPPPPADKKRTGPRREYLEKSFPFALMKYCSFFG